MNWLVDGIQASSGGVAQKDDQAIQWHGLTGNEYYVSIINGMSIEKEKWKYGQSM